MIKASEVTIENPTLSNGAQQPPSAFSFFLAWTIILIILYGFSRFDAGKRITYYVLWLMVVLVVVVRAGDITSLINQGIPSTKAVQSNIPIAQ